MTHRDFCAYLKFNSARLKVLVPRGVRLGIGREEGFILARGHSKDPIEV